MALSHTCTCRYIQLNFQEFNVHCDFKRLIFIWRSKGQVKRYMNVALFPENIELNISSPGFCKTQLKLKLHVSSLTVGT